MDVGRDREDVLDRVDQRQGPGIALEDELRIGLYALSARGLADRVLGHCGRLARIVVDLRPRAGLGGREVEIDDAGLESALASAQWLGDRSVQLPRQEEAGDREQKERGLPRDQARDRTRDDEAEGGPRDLAAEDVRVHLATLTRREVVAGERGDRGAGRRHHGAEHETRQEQAGVAAGKRAQQRGDAPQHDAERQHRDALDAVDEQADGDREDRADQQRDRAQQPDLGVADVQRLLELGRDRADGRGVSPVERQHGPEDRDHSRASRSADPLDHFSPDEVAGPPGHFQGRLAGACRAVPGGHVPAPHARADGAPNCAHRAGDELRFNTDSVFPKRPSSPRQRKYGTMSEFGYKD